MTERHDRDKITSMYLTSNTDQMTLQCIFLVNTLRCLNQTLQYGALHVNVYSVTFY